MKDDSEEEGLGKPSLGGDIGLPRQVAVILVVDVVDSVELMRRHEAATVLRWTDCLKEARNQILPKHQGELVKYLGDGFMARFSSVSNAIKAAAALHAHLATGNQSVPNDAHIALRAGINITEAWSDGVDLYGSGVNIAARVATLAGPGETILSVEARDHVVPGVDAECEDLGICYLKSFKEGIRAFRVGAPGAKPILFTRGDSVDTPIQPTIAVIPFAARSADGSSLAIGDLIAEAVIDRLARGSSMRVISRLSTAPFRDRSNDLPTVASYLGAGFVLSGGYTVSGGNLFITAELSEVKNNEVLWASRLSGSVDDLLTPDSHVARQLALGVHVAIFDLEMAHVTTQPLPTLESYSLLLGGINLMHRSSRDHFDYSKVILEQLIERHGRIAAPRTWLANWYVLRATRGLTAGGTSDADSALAASNSALSRDPMDAQAIAVEGFVHCHLRRDLVTARQRCSHALAINPNCAIAWLYQGAIEAFEGHGVAAVESTQSALELSPIDPQRYYFTSLAATAELSAGNYPRSEMLARESLKANRMHSSTWRVLTIALTQQGRIAEAREAMREVLSLEPALNCRRYLARMPNGEMPTGQSWAHSLAVAGLPD
ncbi:MAG: adenylate/guanylate cyclase domain-containing protein [Rhodoferax sp.]